MGLFWAKYARRIFAIVSTTSIPNLAPVSPTEATVDPPSRGSRLDADHPENGVLIPCRFTLEELEASATEDEVAAGPAETDPTTVHGSTRKKPVRGPLPAHLPRERVVVPAPRSCPCCGGKLVKLGEDVTETLEVVPGQWKVIQTVREKLTCRSCEKNTQPPAQLHGIVRVLHG